MPATQPSAVARSASVWWVPTVAYTMVCPLKSSSPAKNATTYSRSTERPAPSRWTNTAVSANQTMTMRRGPTASDRRPATNMPTKPPTLRTAENSSESPVSYPRSPMIFGSHCPTP